MVLIFLNLRIKYTKKVSSLHAALNYFPILDFANNKVFYMAAATYHCDIINPFKYYASEHKRYKNN